MHSLVIRRASVEDVAILFDIRCSVRENHQSEGELAEIGVTHASVGAMLAGGDYATFIADLDGVSVGFTMAQCSTGYIFACFVRPDFEGRGIGRALMTAAEDAIRLAGVQRAWLSTGADEGLRAIGFYEHLAWRRVATLPDGQLRFEKHLF